MSHDHGEHADAGTLGVHGMALVGEETLYLSHLPMFMVPHNFQVILEVTLDDDAAGRLRESRASSGVGLYTFEPEEFHITDLMPQGDVAPRTQFGGDLVRGHFEKGGETIATGATAKVVGIVYFCQLDFDESARELGYIVFGKGNELFLAHRITAAPDFDQLLSVTIDGLPNEDVRRYVEQEAVADADRLGGFRLTLEGRGNSPSARLRAGDTASGRGHVTGTHQLLNLDVTAVGELYFEEGELAERASFKPTAEESAAGFGE